MPVAKLPFNKQVAYAAGMMGWAIMWNIVVVMVPYFYLPTSKSGLVSLVPQLMVFGLVNIMALVQASGRVFDIITDPLIALMSDKSNNPRGRRLPFMKWAALPTVIFCCLVFCPLALSETVNNAYLLTFTLIGYYVMATAYVIPYYALLAELTETGEEKVRLSSYQQVGYVLGMVFSAMVNNFANVVQEVFHITSRNHALQYTIWGLCIFSGLIMLIPVLAIDEKKYSDSKPSHLPLIETLTKTFRNRNFKYYLISDFSFYMALSIITSGLLYFVTVLLKLDQSEGGPLVGLMVVVSVMFYPLVNIITARFGKKPLVIISFGLLSLIFVTIYFLGKLPFSAHAQIYAMVIFAAFPLASLGILPNAILAEIAEQDAKKTGENREGMFFAVKYLFVKLGQTIGSALFLYLTIYGRDIGNDKGLRLNGICGFVLCILAMLFFSRFREAKPKKQAKVIEAGEQNIV
ncbi:MFS transporter [Mucilaginibacter sp. PPCGB 2223]|uniref:MFS transporter n=1 Tax=Mucilaginibacter sp. PPCGB 2223 TaxID=1886027 RepID=UPI0008250C9A|nr:MFS transporter [Mucilaginibacter sp. PPCGB 2223]OCX54159.1 MFS transporter [Mucilaginibacter sp. PPCGB 2223]